MSSFLLFHFRSTNQISDDVSSDKYLTKYGVKYGVKWNIFFWVDQVEDPKDKCRMFGL